MPGPLIIPGPDGDDLLDVNAAARMLGVKASTLRSHQYQDRRHEGREPWPQPEDPDEVEIALPDGAGIEWARAIDELLLRSGGAGRPVTLWRRSVLAAFKADRMAAGTFAARPANAARVPLRSSAEGPVIGEAVLHGDGTFTASVTDPDAAARLRSSPKPDGISFKGVALRPSGNDVEMDAMLYGESWQTVVRADGGSVQLGESLVRVEPDEPKRLTATEVLERARLRREGKLDG